MVSPAPASRHSWDATQGALVGTLVVVAAVLIGSSPLADNSFLTHLSTGRLILEDGRVPTVDPYSFSAPAAPWVVQSWLASVVYAAVERLAGGLGLRLLFAASCGALGLLLWRLTAPAAGLITRLALAAAALAVGAEMWAERPLMFGLIAFAILLLAADVTVPGPVLLVVGWLWVNTHGSFPLGIVLLGLLALGRRLDGEDPSHELRTLAWTAGGMLLGGLNPVGPKLLFFPIDLLQRQEVLSEVIEWQAPRFTSVGQRVFLVLLVIAGAALVRRPRWRTFLPAAAFTLAALTATRNLPLASLVLVAGAAPGLSDFGSLRSSAVLRRGRLVLALVVLLGGMVLAERLGRDHYDLAGRYPIASLARLEQEDVDLAEVRLVTPDVVGNLLTALHPEERVVYLDDRFDMYPTALVEGYLELFSGRPGWRAQLEKVGADVVVWRADAPLTQLLIADEAWRTVALDERWATFCRRGSELDALGC